MRDRDIATDSPARELFVAWQGPEPHSRWYTVGRLFLFGGGYAFEYTRGFEQARDEAGMQPIYSFPDPLARSVSDELFPLFTNRLMRPSRPDYPQFIEQLGLAEPPDPFDILARSEGYRATDYFRVYLRPQPVPSASGPRFRLICFAAGLRFRSEFEQARAAGLVEGDGLRIVFEPENKVDPHAHRFETLDGFHIGYVPRYYAPDLTRLRALGASIEARVQRNNVDQAPWHRLLLCRIDAPWPVGFEALATDEHQPLRTAAAPVLAKVG